MHGSDNKESAAKIKAELDRVAKAEAEAWGLHESRDSGRDFEQMKRWLSSLKEKREALEGRLEDIESAD